MFCTLLWGSGDFAVKKRLQQGKAEEFSSVVSTGGWDVRDGEQL
jgi:hypothetical protein